MRIVHLLFNLRLGGTETMLIDIMAHQVSMGLDVSLVLINKEHDANLISQIHPKIKIIYINRPEGSKNPWWILKLNKTLFKISPEVIHFHNVRALGLVYKRKGVKHIFTAHCVGVVSSHITRADMICAISNAVKDDLKKRYNIESAVIYNGINLKSISKKSKTSTDTRFRIVQVGRLEHNIKGQDITIKAVEILRNNGINNICVDFIGVGSSMEYLKDLTCKLDLENEIKFLGAKSRAEIYENLSSYDLLVQPSRNEGFGLTLAEGMAARVPVLLSDLPGPMEVIGNGQYGSVFKSEDINDCADKIYDIITKYNKYQNLASNEAYDFLKSNFDIEITAKKYCDKYAEIMSKTNSSPSIKMDLYRYSGNTRLKSFLKHYFLSPGFRITVWFRLASKFNGPFGTILNLILMHYRYLFGIDLKRNTKIGKGFYIDHFSGIVISSATVIGDNCNISQGVTIGVAGKGENRGCPTIGNNVYIGAGAKIIGKITIGNNVAIGANAVVTKDVPDNAVVVGIPAKIISMDGASEILTNCI